MAEKYSPVKTKKMSPAGENKKSDPRKTVHEESYCRNADIFDFAPVGYFILDRKGFIREVNQRGSRLLGIEKRLLKNKSFSRFVKKTERDIFRTHFSEVLQNQTEQACELGIVRKDGTIFYARLQSISSDNDGSGRALIQTAVIDITDRKEQEESLRQSEQRYREIFNATSDAIGIYDENGNILDANDQTFILFRCDRETALSSSVGRFSLGEPPYSQAEAAEKVRKAFHEGPQVFEWLCRRYDNTLFWSEVTLRASEISGRRQVISSLRDISERKQAEETLKHREEELSSIFRAASVGIGVVASRVIKTVNEKLCEMTGYRAEELLDRDARMLYPTDQDYEYVGREKYRQISEKATGMVETRWRRKDGSIMNILLSSSPIDPSDLSKGVTATALDITDRKRAEEALQKAHAELEQSVEERTAELRESEEKFRTLAETSLACIFIYQGDKFIYVNPMMESVTGYSEKELLAMHFWDFMHPDFKELVKERGFARQRGEPVPSKYELKIIRKGGEERWITLYASTCLYSGKQAALGTAFDVTDQKEMEQQLLLYQNHLRSMAAETTLIEERERRKIAANLHDHVIQMMALCKIKVQALKESSGSEHLKSLEEITGFLDQAIQYSRSLVAELSPQILYTLGLEAAIEWFGEQVLEKNGIQFRFQDDGQPKPLKDDARIILFLAVRELLFNIIKHSKAPEAKVTIKRNRNAIQILVEDNGTGFDPSMIISPESSRGFGLFNMREQLYGIGGELKVESKPGHGTCAKITAPVSN